MEPKIINYGKEIVEDYHHSREYHDSQATKMGLVLVALVAGLVLISFLGN